MKNFGPSSIKLRQMVKSNMNTDSVDTDRIFGEAVAAAREENRQLGLASPFSKDGKIYFELADGTITDQVPAYFDKTMEELKQ